MGPSFESRRDQYTAYSETGTAIVNASSPGPTTARPGLIFFDIPEQLAAYQAREPEFGALKASLLGGGQTTGIVSLRGMGGVGKTVLATALAHDQEVRQAFDYGIVWLKFGRTANALENLVVLGRVITGQPANYTSPTEARADLGRLLDQRRLLLVLDDIWDPGLVDSFRNLAPGCHLLVTTRKQAVIDRAGGSAQEVGLLAPPAARALFTEALANAPPPETDAILRHCGGLPLALAAAAGMVKRAGGARTLEALASARLRALKTPWLPDSEQPDLFLVLDASVTELPVRERACLLACAVWPEDVSVALAELPLFWSAHAPDPFDHWEIAEALLDASVLQRGSGDTLRLHDLYHDYLRMLAGPGLAAMHGALADRCVRFQDDRPELLDRSPWVFRHLPWHLVQASRPEQAKALQFDFDWLAAKIAASGVPAVIADTRLLQDADLDHLGRVLRLSAHVLARDAPQLAAQLLGRSNEGAPLHMAGLLGIAASRVPAETLVPMGGKHFVGPGALLATFPSHDRPVRGALLLPDGRRALSWSDDSTLRLWALESGQGRELVGHGGWVNGALLLPDGRRALSWSADRTLRLWDLESGEGRVLAGHGGWVNGALLLPDGRRALSWSDDSTLRLWDLESGERRVLAGHDGAVNGAMLLKDASRAISWSGDNTLRLWDLTEAQEIARFVGDDAITCAAVSAQGRLLLAGDNRGRVMFFDLPP